QNIDLLAGIAFAEGLACSRKGYYEQRLSEVDAIAKGKEVTTNLMHEADAIYGDELKTPARLGLALEIYFQEFPISQDSLVPTYIGTNRAIECTFSIPILDYKHPETGKPLYFKGRLDMLCTEHNRLVQVDDKTSKSIFHNIGTMLSTSSQFYGYNYLIEQTIGKSVVETVINQIALQKNQVTVERCYIPFSMYLYKIWKEQFYNTISEMLHLYHEQMQGEPVEKIPRSFGSGCTMYYKPCPYMDGCKDGDQMLELLPQKIWNYELKQELDLTTHLNLAKME
ncbi:MAG: hypothetical protein ACREVA_02440, partial [Burkholderiales bacterium]